MANDWEAKNFKRIGGHPSLDFVNTVGAWVSDPERKSLTGYKESVLREKLNNYGDLVAWSRVAGLLTETAATQLLGLAQGQPGAASAVVKRALKLRESLYRLCKSVVEDWTPDLADLERLNQELTIARSHQRLVSTGSKFGWNWVETGESLDAVLWPLALSGAELLSSGDLSRLRQCGGEECGWLFLDTSRNRSRQWCEMSDCGNLAKVRRFRRRQAEAQ
jgi:predicted RNA-binding Zn ribbon-like protein